MARNAEEIVDLTPLAGRQIGIGARIGWLLRTWRVSSGTSLRTIVKRLGGAYSAATLSRIETNAVRNGTAIDAYETALGLPHGALRVPVEVLCRTYSYSPTDLSPYRPPASLDDFTAVVAAVCDRPTAGNWLRFAEHHSDGPFGLPAGSVRPLVSQLASELGRGLGAAYYCRYEALARLRCGLYADVVLDVVREQVLADGAQRPFDLMSAVSEHPTPELMTWFGELLLTSDSVPLFRATCLGIQNVRGVGGLGERDWSAMVPAYAEACRRYAEDEARGETLVNTLAACPPEFRRRVAALLDWPLPPQRRPRSWTADRRNVHFRYACEIAAEVARGRPGEPMLARLVFELIFDFRAANAVTSAFLLGASVFAEDLVAALESVSLHGPDVTTRHGAGSAFGNLMLPPRTSDVEPWLSSDDPVIQQTGLALAGYGGIRLDATRLRRYLGGGPNLAGRALFSAGMSEHPALADVARDTSLPRDIRQGAAWWLEEGGRVLR
ncbi:hypothetical protein [Nocardioides sp.]|uniref:hypothetical protein n=1 Tax=Nocardioides sp. TaxID=35761 RepID=UPI0039E68054